MNFLLNIFGNIKTSIVYIGVGLAGLYALKQKWDKDKIQNKLKDIENAVNASNIENIKEVSILNEQAKDIEVSTEINHLRNAIENKDKIDDEITEIKRKVSRSKKIRVEI